MINYFSNTISYTSTDVQHLFIDNLNGSDIMTLDKIKDNQIKDILQEHYNLDEELMSIILDFFEKKIKINNKFEVKGINSNNFINKMENYLQNKGKKIFEKINEFIIEKIKVGNVLKEMLEKDFVQNNFVDMASILINYILFIYKEYVDKSLEYIENNFFLTTLMVINENNKDNENKSIPDQKFIDNEIVKTISDNFLEMLKKTEFEKDEIINNKICLFYKIPGLYILYAEINKYIKENIVNEYYKNENDFRKALPKKGSEEKLIYKFHTNEDNYLERLYNYLFSNELFNSLFKDIIDNINKEFIELLFYDYTTFFLLKNNENYYPSEKDYQLILKLLDIRFKEYKDKNESFNNSKSNLKQFLIKILWIESNYDSIKKILEIYNKFSSIFPDAKNKLINYISEYMTKSNLRYITNETRNPKHTTEINECFYLILASICQCITNEDILNVFNRDNIYNYINKCNEIFPIILRLSDELLLFLNERFIIEEFLLFINYANKIDNIDIIDFSKNLLIRLKNSSSIIQDESEDNIEKLITCFEDTNKYIKNKLEEKGNDEYYYLLSAFYLKELKKLKDTNYRRIVFSHILNDDKIIQKSLESFKFLMKSLLQPEIEKFGTILSDFTKKSDDFMKMIENIVSEELDDILLYLFEKSSFLYFENAETIKDKSLKEKKFSKFVKTSDSSDIILDEPLTIFKNCVKYLKNILVKNDIESKNKKMKKLFCLAYIRVYIYIFAHILNKSQKKNDYEEIIKAMDGEQENQLYFMIRLYFYKLVYNINGTDIGKMRKKEIMEKFYLNKFSNYEEFIKKIKNDTFLSGFILPKDKNEMSKFENLFLKMKDYQVKKFENIEDNSFNEDSDKDLFYIVSADIFSYLVDDSDDSNKILQTNFYNNIIDKFFLYNEKILLKTIFDPNEYSDINQKFNLNNNKNIKEIILYSLRFCLKTLVSSKDDNCFYKSLLSFDKGYLRNSYLIGNDISENNYYDIYSNLINHFQKYPKNSGAYVCLCKTGFYQYIPPDGYPTKNNIYETCKYCSDEIGAQTEKSFEHWYSYKVKYKYTPVKRNGYVRIFKDKKDIEKEPEDKLNSINYMTLEEFKKSKIYALFESEKNGISQVSAEHFKKENKQIRFLTNQISFRLLNFILYSHLFFAGIMNGKKIQSFLPKNMNIIDVLQEDWDLLKIALKDKDIKIFINLVFKELTDELVKICKIEKIEDLFNIEKKLDEIINKSLKEYNDYQKKYYEINNKINNHELDTTLYLLNEYNNHSLYTKKYPFYKYFLYTNYTLENNIKSNDKYKNYIVLRKYLNKDKYYDKIKNLKTLDIFNRFNNLILDTYSNKISKEEAEQKKIEDFINGDEERKSIYEEYLKKIGAIDKELILQKEEPINRFLINKNSDEGKKLIEIYKKYIRDQNYLIDEISKEKHYQNGLPLPEKINAQSIKKEEIFSFDLGKTSLTEIIFESSNRDSSFRNIIVNYNKIEEKLTEILFIK